MEPEYLKLLHKAGAAELMMDCLLRSDPEGLQLASLSGKTVWDDPKVMAAVSWVPS